MKKVLPIILLVIGVYLGQNWSQTDGASEPSVGAAAYGPEDADSQVRGDGVVVNVLSDDNHGSRHQRFILRLGSGQTVLVAHNIDLAPRIPSLREGDRVAFNGEFEWNDKGGVIHWTHRSSRGPHPHGWLEHNGQRYD